MGDTMSLDDQVQRLCDGIKKAERELWPDLVRSSARRMVMVDGVPMDVPGTGDPYAFARGPKRRMVVMVDGSEIELSVGETDALAGCFELAREPEIMTDGWWDDIQRRFNARVAASPYPEHEWTPPAPRGLAALGCGLASDPLGQRVTRKVSAKFLQRNRWTSAETLLH